MNKIRSVGPPADRNAALRRRFLKPDLATWSTLPYRLPGGAAAGAGVIWEKFGSAMAWPPFLRSIQNPNIVRLCRGRSRCRQFESMLTKKPAAAASRPCIGRGRLAGQMTAPRFYLRRPGPIR